MKIFLLDINLLLALTDPMHVHHKPSHQWFDATGHQGWATCPITENGFVRIASHPNYPNRPGDVSSVLSILHKVCKSPGHHFWTEDLSIVNILESDSVITHAQITDVYLLGLAVQKNGMFATLDRHIPVDVVSGGRQALELIST
ncbi:MAG: TA system VapC family ribonuclease toxin [Desulfobacterales bacterium]